MGDIRRAYEVLLRSKSDEDLGNYPYRWSPPYEASDAIDALRQCVGGGLATNRARFRFVRVVDTGEVLELRLSDVEAGRYTLVNGKDT